VPTRDYLCVTTDTEAPQDPDTAYANAVAEYGAALGRLVRVYEIDPSRRGDLEQDIHFALWRSLALFDGRCSLRTWVYRVAHNTAASYVVRQRRLRLREPIGLEELEARTGPGFDEGAVDEAVARERLTDLVARLPPIDRQVIVLYLEGLSAAEIGEVTGLRPGHVSTKVHRIKRVLAQKCQRGDQGE